jgi:hypothetical protein
MPHTAARDFGIYKCYGINQFKIMAQEPPGRVFYDIDAVIEPEADLVKLEMISL